MSGTNDSAVKVRMRWVPVDQILSSFEDEEPTEKEKAQIVWPNHWKSVGTPRPTKDK